MVTEGERPAIVNCHAHVFTNDSVPNQLVAWPLPLVPLLRQAFIGKPLSRFLRNVIRSRYDWLERAASVADMSAHKTQIEVFQILKGYYPRGTKFVLLSMDLEHMGRGKVPQRFEDQLEGLAAIKEAYPDLVYPFICVDPRHEGVEALVTNGLASGTFHGIKIYPPLGYVPHDKGLQEIYQYVADREIPVLAHCTPRGVRGRRYEDEDGYYASPGNYEKVLAHYPNLKLCLAHFGGLSEWRKYLRAPWSTDQPAYAERSGPGATSKPGSGWDPQTGEVQERTWVAQILEMIESEKYPNLYTDISYTAHDPRMHAFLKVLLEDEVVCRRVLFGSDYYMVQLETSERDFSIGLRGYLGEEKFDRIARENPRRYLRWMVENEGIE